MARSSESLDPAKIFPFIQTSSSGVFSQVAIWMRNIIKRAFDIILSAMALFVLAPVFALIAVVIRRDTPGPVIYRGWRTGRRGKPFQISKFRTMYENPQSYAGPGVTAHDDPRITPLGRWLRDTKLNELPQFWNVLIGDMSLVGPRPEDTSISKTWPSNIRREILSVRPGITSPATVQYRNEETLLSSGNVLQKYMRDVAPDKMRLDQLYVRYHSLLLDMDILLWTFLLLLPRIKEHTPSENFLFVGPISRFIRRYVSWFMVDFLITLAAMGFSGIVWTSYNLSYPNGLQVLASAGSYVLIYSLVGLFFGVNRIHWSQAVLEDVIDLLPGWAAATVTFLLMNHIVTGLPLTMILMSSAISLIGFTSMRYRSHLVSSLISRITRVFRGIQVEQERVLIVGGFKAAQHVAWILDHPANTGKYNVVGLVENDLLNQGMRVFGSKVIGTYKDIPRLLHEKNIGMLLLTEPKISPEDFKFIHEACVQNSIRFLAVPGLLTLLKNLAEVSPSQTTNTVDSSREEDLICLYCTNRLGILSNDNIVKEK